MKINTRMPLAAKLLSFLILCITLLVPSRSAWSDDAISIATFDEPDAFTGWSFSRSTEFGDGAVTSGSLKPGPGYVNQGAVLKYDFKCLPSGVCGHYAAANWKPAEPLKAGTQSALTMWVRTAPNVNIILRIKDANDQFLVYQAEVPDPKSSEWQRVTIPFVAPQTYWGGDKNGRLRGGIKELGILADSADKTQAASGEISFDQVRLFDPDAGTLLEDFERLPQLLGWTVPTGGTEFRNTTSYLSILSGGGYTGNGARLDYQFTCAAVKDCGRYVIARWNPRAMLRADSNSALSLWIQPNPDVRILVRVNDRSGQTLVYRNDALTLENAIAGGWQRITVPLKTPVDHWGGTVNDGNIQQGITEISIVAENRYSQAATGSIVIDEVRLHNSVYSTFNLNPAAATITPTPGTDSSANRFGVAVHYWNNLDALRLAKEAGFDFIRTDLIWASMEKNGKYDFARADALLKELEKLGLGVVWILDYGHPDHGGGLPPTAAKDVEAFAAYAKAAATNFKDKKNVRYEIWNEPNWDPFWKPAANPAEYRALLKATITGLRLGDSSATIMTGGLSGIDLPFLKSVLESGDAKGANAIGVHPYRTNSPESFAADLLSMQAMVKRTLGDRVQVFSTEWGYPSYGFFPSDYGDGHSDAARKRQAVMAAREMLTIWTLGVPMGVWYDLNDDGSNPLKREENFGLLNTDNSDKPAMSSMRTMLQNGKGRRYAGLVPDAPYGLHAVRLDGANDSVFVVWSDQPSAVLNVQFYKDKFIGASDMYGRPLKLDENGTQNGAVIVEEANGPVYLRWRR